MPDPDEGEWLQNPPALFVDADDEAWRGDVHPREPPVFDSPEWRMWKARLDRDELGDTSTAAPDEDDDGC